MTFDCGKVDYRKMPTPKIIDVVLVNDNELAIKYEAIKESDDEKSEEIAAKSEFAVSVKLADKAEADDWQVIDEKWDGKSRIKLSEEMLKKDKIAIKLRRALFKGTILSDDSNIFELILRKKHDYTFSSSIVGKYVKPESYEISKKGKMAKLKSDKSSHHIVLEPAIAQKSGKYQLSIQVESKRKRPCRLLGVISDSKSKKIYDACGLHLSSMSIYKESSSRSIESEVFGDRQFMNGDIFDIELDLDENKVKWTLRKTGQSAFVDWNPDEMPVYFAVRPNYKETTITIVDSIE